MRLVFAVEFNEHKLTDRSAIAARDAGHFSEFAESELENRVSSWGAQAKGVVVCIQEQSALFGEMRQTKH